MDLQEPSRLVVDPEVQAHVNSLVSAVGGTGADEYGRYILGDDALACLKDLKKWLRLYDEKLNRLDVARCMAEANLVKGDLLEILAAWPEAATEDKFKSKVALACMELLVPLTWPIEKDDAQMTVNHHKHIPYLRHAQRSYKRAVLEHETGTILRTCVRIALPSIALPLRERAPRDEGVIKLLLYLLRNMVMITESRKSESGEVDGVLSRSAIIEAFRSQEVLALLLTMGSNMGEDFSNQDTIMLEVLFHLLKGVNVEKLFTDRKTLADNDGKELKALLSKEAGMHRSYNRHAPTRHNRFGTMIWVKREGEGRHSAVSGQDVLRSEEQTLSKMDQTKKWNRPKRLTKEDEVAADRFDLEEPLTDSARTHLRSFVEEFLDSSFNPLFNHIRRAVEREADRVLENHRPQYFYLIAWFLEAERVRRRKQAEARKASKDKKLQETFEPESFSLVASVLTQESFVMLNRFMQDRLDMKEWRDLQAGMRCFTQTLLIIQDMAESPAEEDQEIAENIQNRIFYEETTHDRVVAILRGYKDQGFGYLNACTQLAHVFLRMLEMYSREHSDLQIRSKRKARKQKKVAAKKAQATAGSGSQDGDNDEAEGEDSEMEEVREAERTSRERQFDFKRFSTKFTTQACVDTFVHFLKYYNDLDVDQLKRAHRFFYRVAFKQELSVMLFRLDIVALFNRMIKGPEDLDSKNPMFKEWSELIRQVLKRLFKKLDQRPQLFIELLFSKIPATVFFLENGYEKQTISSKARPPAALHVRGDFDLHCQIGIILRVLRDNQDTNGVIPWIAKVVDNAATERQSWADEQTARQELAEQPQQLLEQPEDSEIQPSTSPTAEPTARAPIISVIPSSEPLRVAMFRDAKLRLLMELMSFERLGIDDILGTTWIIPSSVSGSTLRQHHESVLHFQSEPFSLKPARTSLEDDEEDAGNETNADKADRQEAEAEDIADLLRRKPIPKTARAAYDDDSDGSLGIGSDADNDFLFPAGGPTTDPALRKNAKALDLLKKKRRRRVRKDEDGDEEGGLDEETLKARRRARQTAEMERHRKIKSEQFVRDSDDESDVERDREFFEREKARREGQRTKVMEALAVGRKSAAAAKSKKQGAAKGKRKSDALLGDDGVGVSWKKWKASSDAGFSDDDDMDIEHDLPDKPVRPPDSTRVAALPSSDNTIQSGDDDLVGGDETDTPASSPPFSTRKGHNDPPLSGDVGEGEHDSASPPSSQGETRIKTAELRLSGGGAEEEDDDDVVGPAVGSRRRIRAVFDDSDDE